MDADGRWALLGTLALLAACGGGGGSAGDTPSPGPSPAAPTDAQRIEATRTTAAHHGACQTVAPFYWEIGQSSGALASGSIDVAGAPAYRADTAVALASASKWIYGAYVAERRAGALTAEDLRYLNFRAGYTSFQVCLRGQTVDQCLAFPAANGAYTAPDDGYFAYGGGHMQKHASLIGLGGLDSMALAAEVQGRLGADLGLSYSQPQLAGGGRGSAQGYARFLQKLLAGQLQLGALLGKQAVCTNPATCASAKSTPIPGNESWHYAAGHWVEDDPALGDGAFSSPGAFGFYPWIDTTRRWYGLLVRESASGGGVDSVACGRLLRKAWVTGAAP